MNELIIRHKSNTFEIYSFKAAYFEFLNFELCSQTNYKSLIYCRLNKEELNKLFFY